MKFNMTNQFVVAMNEYGEWVAYLLENNQKVPDIEGTASSPLMALHELLVNLAIEDEKEGEEQLSKYVL